MAQATEVWRRGTTGVEGENVGKKGYGEMKEKVGGREEWVMLLQLFRLVQLCRND